MGSKRPPGSIKYLRVINGLRAINEGPRILRKGIHIDRNLPKGGGMRYPSESLRTYASKQMLIVAYLRVVECKILKTTLIVWPTYRARVQRRTRLRAASHRGSSRYNTLGPPGPKGLHPKTFGFEEEIHLTASGFLDKSPSSLWVPGQKSIQPSGSWTKVHPASGFLDESPSSLRVLDESPSSLWVSR